MLLPQSQSLSLSSSPSLSVPLLSCLSLCFSLVCTCIHPALSLSMSVCLSAFPSLVCSCAFYFVPNSPHDHFVLVFHSFFSLSHCLIVAFFVSLSALLCLCLCLLFFPSLSLFPPLPHPPHHTFIVVVVVVVYCLHREPGWGEREE